MKRNKHICINFDESQYNKIIALANHTRRKAADVCYLIIIDNLQSEILKACDLGCSIEKVNKKRF